MQVVLFETGVLVWAYETVQLLKNKGHLVHYFEPEPTTIEELEKALGGGLTPDLVLLEPGDFCDQDSEDSVQANLWVEYVRRLEILCRCPVIIVTASPVLRRIANILKHARIPCFLKEIHAKDILLIVQAVEADEPYEVIMALPHAVSDQHVQVQCTCSCTCS